MRVGIMQPYFFPYLGHFALIASVNEWVVFDVTQYTPKTWINRNRILHAKTGWQYVTVPLANSSISIKIADARVLNLNDAMQSILGKLSHYKKKAPYFYQVNKIVQQAFQDSANDLLVSLNISALRTVCEYLGIPFNYQICSEFLLNCPRKFQPGEWAPHICHILGASEYVNPAGGKELFDVSIFRQLGITLYFAEFAEFNYATSGYSYTSHLSILDVMMWNSPQDIALALRKGTTLIEAT